MNSSLFFTKLLEQVILVGLTTLIAICIGIPLGITSYKLPRFKLWIFSGINICQTIPSLALLACLIPLLGIGIKSALLTMTLYAILPVVMNTYSGLEAIPPEQIEAADGLGFTPFQKLRIVELPLAFPIMITGMRTAAVMSVGVATIASFIGAGGLGDFIFQGIATNNINTVLYGAIPTAMMALLIDYAFRKIAIIKSFAKIAVVSIIFVTVFYQNGFFQQKPSITVATKNFTEQFILGEMIAQLLEKHTPYPVKRKFNLGSTDLCHQAMLNGDIDIYPEYTGTAHLLVLKENNYNLDPDELFDFVNQHYQEKFGIEWLHPLGFSNTEVLIARSDQAEKYQWRSIGDIKPHAEYMAIGAPAEFCSRPDGLINFKEKYGIVFKKTVLLEPGLMYEAALQGDVDLIAGFSTHPKLQDCPLVSLNDDLKIFPPYHAAILIRQDIIKNKPEIKEILLKLSGIISEEKIRKLNYMVEVENKNINCVVEQFLTENQLLTMEYPEL